MKLYLNIPGIGVRGAEVYIDRAGFASSGHWLDDETELSETDLDLFQEYCEEELGVARAEAALDRAYDRWKDSRFE